MQPWSCSCWSCSSVTQQTLLGWRADPAREKWVMELGHCPLPTRNQSRNPGMENKSMLIDMAQPGLRGRAKAGRRCGYGQEQSYPRSRSIVGARDWEHTRMDTGRDRANCGWHLPSTRGILRPDCWNWRFPARFSIKKNR